MSDSAVAGEHRLGVVAVFVENRLETAPKVNQVLSDYGQIVVGRMGIPYHGRVHAGWVQSPFSSDESGDSPRESRSSPPERNLSVIAVIVDGTNDEIGAMTGRLGAIPGVDVKSALRKKEGGEANRQERQGRQGDEADSRSQKSETRMQKSR
jgi:hypothetical protein